MPFSGRRRQGNLHQKIRPDLILADFNLPGYSGSEALIYAKEHKSFIPFVFITGALKSENEPSRIILESINDYQYNLNILPETLEKVMKNTETQLLKRKEQAEAECQKQVTILKITEL